MGSLICFARKEEEKRERVRRKRRAEGSWESEQMKVQPEQNRTEMWNMAAFSGGCILLWSQFCYTVLCIKNFQYSFYTCVRLLPSENCEFKIFLLTIKWFYSIYYGWFMWTFWCMFTSVFDILCFKPSWLSFRR